MVSVFVSFVWSVVAILLRDDMAGFFKTAIDIVSVAPAYSREREEMLIPFYQVKIIKLS
jgi:hypothetical protein